LQVIDIQLVKSICYSFSITIQSQMNKIIW